MMQDWLDVAQRALTAAQGAGADHADAVVVSGISTHVGVLDGKSETIERAESLDLGLRVFAGKSQAIVSASRFEPDDLTGLAARAVAMARAAPPDPFAGLAEIPLLAGELPVLEIADDADPSADALIETARQAESAGQSVKGINKSAGTSASASRSRVVLATTTGFSGHYDRTGYGVSASMIAGEGAAMVRDYDYASSVYLADLPPPADIGQQAGERTARRINPRKVSSRQVPVVFEQRLASSLIGHLASAINGVAVARGTSFLKDAMSEQIFSDSVTVIDDGRRARGHSSKPFDADATPTRRRTVIDNGVLAGWFLDCRSARQLDLPPTGSAVRGVSSPPSPSASNLWMEPGGINFDDLLAGISDGLYVTEMIGMGVNPVTGDYSRGAAGFWIENGEITFPVSELTIAGNLRAMFASLTPANDLVMRGSLNAPSCLVEGMTVAGT